MAAHAALKYQKEVEGKRVGRYINTPDDGELADVLEDHIMEIGDARALDPKLDTHCFEMIALPTAVQNFADDAEIHSVYYKEMEELVKKATGAEKVILFDHTVRDTSAAVGLNAKAGEVAAPVTRVHTDYTDNSGPRRVQALTQNESYTGVKLTEEQRAEIMARDFCIVNVWRNISEVPVQSMPLGFLNPSSVDRKDFVPYEMRFPDRTGENYGMKHNPEHKWFFYPLLQKEECIVFTTWDKREDRPRYCFHSAFSDLDEAADAPPRTSIEVRTVAIMPAKAA